MFFDDEPLKEKKNATLRIPPPIPDTGWQPPYEFPNLTTATLISVDVETYDPELIDFGPGWARKKGHIVGVSIGAIDQYGNTGAWYFPVRHEVEPHLNLNSSYVFSWLKTILETPAIPKAGANLMYDIGWLTEENIYVQGVLFDVQFAEALLDERSEVNLEYLGQKYVKSGKNSDLMYRWLAEAYGGEVNSKQRANIYRCSPRLVGHYAEQDAALPIQIIKAQWPDLVAQDMMTVFRMECDLIYLLVEMRLQGVTIDLRAAETLYVQLAEDIKNLYNNLAEKTGVRVDSTSGANLVKLFDAVGLQYPKTDAGNASFRKEWLKALDHPVGIMVNDIREHEKIRGTFIRSYILENNVKGKLYCQFHPLKGDDGGTGVGRFSSSDPNLQNIPARTQLGKKVRKLFINDPGHLCWQKTDYSQIHYRILGHVAVGPGSDELRRSYIENPHMDYHDLVYYKVCPLMGWNPEDEEAKKINRRPIKNINFGLLNGQGEASLGYKAGLSKKAASTLFKAYFDAATYVKPTMDAKSEEAMKLGYIRSFLGRRVRFRLWEPTGYEQKRPLPYDLALREYGTSIQLAYVYRALNYYLQPTEADIMKSAMLNCYKQGVFRVTGVPRLTCHDELGFSVPNESKEVNEAFDYMKYVLENTLKLRVPIRVDVGRGPNWGSIG